MSSKALKRIAVIGFVLGLVSVLGSLFIFSRLNSQYAAISSSGASYSERKEKVDGLRKNIDIARTGVIGGSVLILASGVVLAISQYRQ